MLSKLKIRLVLGLNRFVQMKNHFQCFQTYEISYWNTCWFYPVEFFTIGLAWLVVYLAFKTTSIISSHLIIHLINNAAGSSLPSVNSHCRPVTNIISTGSNNTVTGRRYRIVYLTVVRTSLCGVHFNDPIVFHDQLSTPVHYHHLQQQPWAIYPR